MISSTTSKKGSASESISLPRRRSCSIRLRAFFLTPSPSFSHQLNWRDKEGRTCRARSDDDDEGCIKFINNLKIWSYRDEITFAPAPQFSLVDLIFYTFLNDEKWWVWLRRFQGKPHTWFIGRQETDKFDECFYWRGKPVFSPKQVRKIKKDFYLDYFT